MEHKNYSTSVEAAMRCLEEGLGIKGIDDLLESMRDKNVSELAVPCGSALGGVVFVRVAGLHAMHSSLNIHVEGVLESKENLDKFEDVKIEALVHIEVLWDEALPVDMSLTRLDEATLDSLEGTFGARASCSCATALKRLERFLPSYELPFLGRMHLRRDVQRLYKHLDAFPDVLEDLLKQV